MPGYSRKVQISGKTAQELYDKIATEIETFLGKASIGPCEVGRSPEKKEISIKASMFSGILICTDGAVELNGKLSLMAMPFKSKLDEGIDRWITKTFKS